MTLGFHLAKESPTLSQLTAHCSPYHTPEHSFPLSLRGLILLPISKNSGLKPQQPVDKKTHCFNKERKKKKMSRIEHSIILSHIYLTISFNSILSIKLSEYIKLPPNLFSSILTHFAKYKNTSSLKQQTNSRNFNTTKNGSMGEKIRIFSSTAILIRAYIISGVKQNLQYPSIIDTYTFSAQP